MGSHKDVDRGWAWIVLGAASFNLIILGSMTVSIGMFQAQFLRHFDESTAFVSLICALCGCLQCLLGPVASFVCNVYGIRVAMMLGGALLSVGLVSSSFATSAPQLLVFYGIIAGSGYGIVYTPSLIVVGHYFSEKRVLANGLALSCTGLGMMSGPHLIAWLIDHLEWRFALAAFGWIASQMVVSGSLVFPLQQASVRLHHNKIYKPANEKASDCKGSSTEQSCCSPRKQRCVSLRSLSVLKNRLVWVLALSYFFDCIGYSTNVIHFPSYVRWIGVSHHKVPTLFTVYGITITTARILGGAFCNDKSIDLLMVAIACNGLKGFSVLFMPLYAKGFITLMFYEVLFALYYGMGFVLMTPIVVQLLGVDNLVTVFGLLMFVGGSSYLLGPTLAGYIYDTTSSYSVGFHIAGSFIVLGSLTLSLIPLLQERRKPERETEDLIVEAPAT